MGKSVSYNINAKDKTKQALKSAQGGVKGFVNQLGSLKTAIAGAFVVKGIKMAADAIGDLTDTYGVQQAAELKLSSAVKNNPLLNGDSAKRLKAYASELQGTSIFGDEQLIEYQSWLAAQGQNEESIKAIMEASVELASSGVMPLESAVKNLAKSYSGTAGELGESIPALKELTKEQLANGEAVRLVAQQYDGMAAAVAGSETGVKQQLENLKGDIKESLGEIWSGIRGDANKNMLNVFQNINNWLQTNKQTIVNVFRGIPQIALSTFNLIKNIFKQVFSAEFVISMVKLYISYLKAVTEMLKEYILIWASYISAIGITIWAPLSDGFKFVISGIKFAFDEVVNFFIRGLNAILEQINKIADTKLGQKLGFEGFALAQEKTVEYERPEYTMGSGRITDAWKNVGDRLISFIPDQLDRLKDLWGEANETGASLFGDEFAIFAEEMEKILGQPLPLDTSGLEITIPGAGGAGGSSGPTGSGSGSGFNWADVFEGTKDQFAGMADISGMLTGMLTQLLSGLTSVTALMTWGSVIIDGFLSVVAGPLNQLLSPLVGMLSIIGQTLGQILIPVLNLLTPILEVINAAFLGLYNYAIRPFANLIIGLIVEINNFFASMINSVIRALNNIPFVDIGWRMKKQSYGDMSLKEISKTDLTNAGDSYIQGQGGSVGYGGSSGAGASYSQARDIYLTMNINYQVGISAFDDNDLAVKMNEAIERAKRLGLTA